MGDREQVAKRPHNLALDNRRALSLSGVNEVHSFDDESVVLKTELGELTVRGRELNINHLDKTSGELRINGEISELVYSNRNLESKSIWAKLLR